MRNGKRPLRTFIFAVGVFAVTVKAEVRSGKVVNSDTVPLPGVQVQLTLSGTTGLTGTDGIFELQTSLSIPFRGRLIPQLGFILRQNRLEFTLPNPQAVSIAIFSTSGENTTTLCNRRFESGVHGLSLSEWAAHVASGRYILVIRAGDQAYAYATLLLTQGQIGSLNESEFSPNAPSLLKKSALSAVTDTLSLSKSGFFPKKIALGPTVPNIMGNVFLNRNWISINNAKFDQYDELVVEKVARFGFDSTFDMVVKAETMIESTMNPEAISMYQTTLPCGTHSYGIIQVTPGCIKNYAALPSTTPVTATVSGGISGSPVKVVYFDPKDEAAGNTIVKENNIVINLVSNPDNPLYATSAFNPAYTLEYGVQELARLYALSKSKFPGCSDKDYVFMMLAGYFYGAQTISGCGSAGTLGQNYANSVLTQYRKFCQQAGISSVY